MLYNSGDSLYVILSCSWCPTEKLWALPLTTYLSICSLFLSLFKHPVQLLFRPVYPQHYGNSPLSLSCRVCPAGVHSAGPVDTLPHHPIFSAFRPPVAPHPEGSPLPALLPMSLFSDRHASVSHLSSTPHIVLVHFSLRLTLYIFRLLSRKFELCKAVDCRSHVSGKYGTIPVIICVECGPGSFVIVRSSLKSLFAQH